MEIRLYIDEDAMSRALVRGLRSRGIDVTTVNEEEMAGQGDTTQLEYALQKERVFYTFNVGDFCRLHREYLTRGKSHSGIIVVNRQRYTIGEQLRFLLNLAKTKSADEMRNQLVFLV
jgi:uncharacterized protein DUF5615